MSLYDIKNKLYKKDADPDLSGHDISEYDPDASPARENSAGENSDLWAQRKKGLSDQQKKQLKLAGMVAGGLAVIGLLIAGALWYRASSFSEERVTVEIVGVKDSESGKLLTYEILVKNNNRAKLQNTTLKMSYPENFKPQDNPNFTAQTPTTGTFSLGEIVSHGEKRIVFNARMYSPRGSLMYLKADLSYQPSTLSSQFISGAQLGINVNTTPISLEIVAPQNVSSGDEVNYLVNYKNIGEQPIEGLRIQAEYPGGFIFSKSEPAVFEGNSTWYIGSLSPGESGKVVITGKLEGGAAEVKNVKVVIGAMDKGKFVSYNEEDADTKIVASPLVIFQTVNDVTSFNARSGEMLRFEINYKNNGKVGLRDSIVTASIDSPVLDYTTLDMDGGLYDSSTKTIMWKASDYPELANLQPNQGGVIKFSIKVNNVLPITSTKDKNFVISSLAKIDSPDVPTPISMNKIIAGNKLDIKLNSKLFLDVRGYYTDPNITNFGPVPPQVDQETTYTIHWIASNINNDISDAKVEAVLPTSVVMTGAKFPQDANITYNERNNSISWTIGNMPAGTGVISSPKEVSFQVKIKPSINQVGQMVDLVGESTFTAKDLFTGDNLTSVFEKKTTELREDASIGDGYKVVN